MKVLCLWYATEDEISSIKRAMPKGTEVVAPKGEYFSRFESTYSELERHARDADAMIGWSIPKGLLEVAKNLKILCWQHSGCDDLDLKLLKQRDVKVANIRGANAVAVAEHAMMFVLALAKQTLIKHRLALDVHKPFPTYGDDHRSAMLDGRTIAVIGVGSIGSRIAKYAKGFDMRVLGVRRKRGEAVPHVDSMHGIDELHAVLSSSDYVVLALPVTDETYHVIGKAELAAMKRSAFLVNVSRGNLVQEKPLYEALTSGRLRGFAADVWPNYTYGRSFPHSTMPRLQIHRLPNVTGSFDQAANADDVLERDIEWGIQNLAEFAGGKPLTRGINLDLGY
ncbi:NAD(P)-dependent oxidoreductase [Bradyrhizobium canariense]|uniref:Phosphoglycerate dehydrogenase n=1 Tax=Bradyrhizobium canariense TaxID=255045 RepID=A0A1X3G0Q8_9BRAD|nr:NAD(P)-dependent oxidoreductase [Bradyrhizobium canariense]OSI73172.1 phosphoglycerate dehydrogenase [Bradyrhizobium canariense]OSI81274.1 phosphoglycerate dehydrogenase [Bradyrhizobium canariense]OSI94549.1 phosphoglycerate dehydrogenase [Bradyrhizobium canariense]OSI95137.1 phosphoglycerate dehydrogenase [Bradyrhizobium canariense]OSJ08182.1 phosphoglycerate dehydrogenase [Bradyrhizobium canariense]